MKLCTYILCSYRYTIAKYCLIILKYDKAMWFQTRQHHGFDVVKIFNSKETKTRNKLYNYFLQQSITNCSFNVTLSVQSVHHWPARIPSGVLWRLKSLTALLMGCCGTSFHIDCKASFSSAIVFGFGCSLWYLSSMAPSRDSQGVQIWRIWWPLVLLNHLRTDMACSHSCVTRAVCAGAPSCWKMNPAGINWLQSWRSTADPVASTRRQIFCAVLNFHCFAGTHELLLLLRIPAHASSAFAFCPHTFPIVTALTKCSLLTNISKKTSCLFTRQILAK